MIGTSSVGRVPVSSGNHSGTQPRSRVGCVHRIDTAVGSAVSAMPRANGSEQAEALPADEEGGHAAEDRKVPADEETGLASGQHKGDDSRCLTCSKVVLAFPFGLASARTRPCDAMAS